MLKKELDELQNLFDSEVKQHQNVDRLAKQVKLTYFKSINLFLF